MQSFIKFKQHRDMQKDHHKKIFRLMFDQN